MDLYSVLLCFSFTIKAIIRRKIQNTWKKSTHDIILNFNKKKNRRNIAHRWRMVNVFRQRFQSVKFHGDCQKLILLKGVQVEHETMLFLNCCPFVPILISFHPTSSCSLTLDCNASQPSSERFSCSLNLYRRSGNVVSVLFGGCFVFYSFPISWRVFFRK